MTVLASGTLFEVLIGLDLKVGQFVARGQHYYLISL